MKITYQSEPNGRETYDVLSDSGKTYRVRYCGSGDGNPDYVALWECNCPAGQHGHRCKHVDAVAAVANSDPIESGAVLREA